MYIYIYMCMYIHMYVYIYNAYAMYIPCIDNHIISHLDMAINGSC